MYMYFRKKVERNSFPGSSADMENQGFTYIVLWYIFSVIDIYNEKDACDFSVPVGDTTY